MVLSCISNVEDDAEVAAIKKDILHDDVQTEEDLLLGLCGGLNANIGKDLKLYKMMFICLTLNYCGLLKIALSLTSRLVDKLYTKVFEFHLRYDNYFFFF